MASLVADCNFRESFHLHDLLNPSWCAGVVCSDGSTVLICQYPGGAAGLATTRALRLAPTGEDVDDPWELLPANAFPRDSQLALSTGGNKLTDRCLRAFRNGAGFAYIVAYQYSSSSSGSSQLVVSRELREKPGTFSAFVPLIPTSVASYVQISSPCGGILDNANNMHLFMCAQLTSTGNENNLIHLIEQQDGTLTGCTLTLNTVGGVFSHVYAQSYSSGKSAELCIVGLVMEVVRFDDIVNKPSQFTSTILGASHASITNGACICLSSFVKGASTTITSTSALHKGYPVWVHPTQSSLDMPCPVQLYSNGMIIDSFRPPAQYTWATDTFFDWDSSDDGSWRMMFNSNSYMDVFVEKVAGAAAPTLTTLPASTSSQLQLVAPFTLADDTNNTYKRMQSTHWGSGVLMRLAPSIADSSSSSGHAVGDGETVQWLDLPLGKSSTTPVAADQNDFSVPRSCGVFARPTGDSQDVCVIVVDPNVGLRLFHCDVQTLEWVAEDVVLTTDVTENDAALQQYYAYAIHVRVLDDNGQPAPNFPVVFWADRADDSNKQISINGVFYEMPASQTDNITAVTDADGRLVCDMLTYFMLAPTLHFWLGGTTQPFDVQPDGKLTEAVKDQISKPNLVAAVNQLGEDVFAKEYQPGGAKNAYFNEAHDALISCANYHTELQRRPLSPQQHAARANKSIFVKPEHAALIRSIVDRSSGRSATRGTSAASAMRIQSRYRPRSLRRVYSAANNDGVLESAELVDWSFSDFWDEVSDVYDMVVDKVVDTVGWLANKVEEGLDVAWTFVYEGASHLIDLVIDTAEKALAGIQTILGDLLLGLEALCPWLGIILNWDHIKWAAEGVQLLPPAMKDNLTTVVSWSGGQVKAMLEAAKSGWAAAAANIKSEYGSQTLLAALTSQQASAGSVGGDASTVQQTPSVAGEQFTDFANDQARASLQCQCATNRGVSRRTTAIGEGKGSHSISSSSSAGPQLSHPPPHPRSAAVLHPSGRPLPICQTCSKPRSHVRRRRRVPERYARMEAEQAERWEKKGAAARIAQGSSNWWDAPVSTYNDLWTKLQNDKELQQAWTNITNACNGKTWSETLETATVSDMLDVLTLIIDTCVDVAEVAINTVVSIFTTAIANMWDVVIGSSLYVPVLSELLDIFAGVKLPSAINICSYLLAMPLTIYYKVTHGGQQVFASEADAQQLFKAVMSDFLTMRNIPVTSGDMVESKQAGLSSGDGVFDRGIVSFVFAAVGSVIGGVCEWFVHNNDILQGPATLVAAIKEIFDFVADFFAMPWFTHSDGSTWVSKTPDLTNPDDWEEDSSVFWVVSILQTGLAFLGNAVYFGRWTTFSKPDIETYNKFFAVTSAGSGICECVTAGIVWNYTTNKPGPNPGGRMLLAANLVTGLGNFLDVCKAYESKDPYVVALQIAVPAVLEVLGAGLELGCCTDKYKPEEPNGALRRPTTRADTVIVTDTTRSEV